MDERTRELLFSSTETRWSTPQPLFNILDNTYHFTLDPCAEDWNAKCPTYFTVEDNGLEQSWAGHTVFMNPPYNRPENACKPNCTKKICQKRGFHLTERLPGINDWIEKAYTEHKKYGITVVSLLPARTDTQWFHKYIYNQFEVYFLKGRVRFVLPEGVKYPAPFPSMIVRMQWGK